MPKNKRDKYERVKTLPNVTIIETDESPGLDTYPWNRQRGALEQLVLELGCGKGEYSLVLAAANPNCRVVGVDYKSHRICVGAEQALAGGVENVHFLRARIEALSQFFASHSIHAIWLTFPDPHLKSRKAKCRLTAPFFLDLYADLLIPGGIVHLKTDSARLYQYTREMVLRRGECVVDDSEDLLHSRKEDGFADKPVSAYEKAALSRGAVIRMLAFTLNDVND
jgi:tRNA (guanine-N7-)-methyltransferase